MTTINVTITPSPQAPNKPKTRSWVSGGNTVTVTVHKGRDETEGQWEKAFQEAVAAAMKAWPEDR